MPGFLPLFFVRVVMTREISRIGRNHASDMPRDPSSDEKTMKISVFGTTDRGKVREKNEDDLAVVDLTQSRTLDPPRAEDLPVGPQGVLLAVCDGVGGHRAGEVAAALALENLAEEMESLGDGCPRASLFQTAVERVNRRVWETARSSPALEGMATTLTAAVVCRERVILAHVGDSRAYIVRNGAMRQITRDQSFVESMVASGAMTREEAERSPFRNVILQAVGRRKSVQIALDGFDARSGDVLLLCTDGLSTKVRAEEMAGRLKQLPLSEAVNALIEEANARGGEDNITALAARIER
jgi:serine/threonine protein phosphatase PrpC